MKWIVNLKQHLNFERVLPYALVFVLSILSINVHTIHNAMGQVSREEPYISLIVKNKPLGDVLKKISADTGYKFKLNNQWSGYLVSATLENMPLHQVLKRILGRLSHTIIYDSDKSIHIVIYAEADSRKIDPHSIKSPLAPIEKYQLVQPPSPGRPPEEANEVERVIESSRETSVSGATEEKSTEKKESAENAEKESVETTGAGERKGPDKGPSSRNDNSNEQNEQQQVDEVPSPDSSQK